MTYAAGNKLTAARTNRLAPKPYYANASGTVAASSTNVDVPGCSVTFTTETNGATVQISWSAAIYCGGTAATTNGNVRALLDGTGAPVYALAEIRTANEKAVCAQFWQTTIATAGSHTIKLQATTPANITIGVYTALQFVVFEVV